MLSSISQPSLSPYEFQSGNHRCGALWFEIVWNRRIRFTDSLCHKVGSETVSECSQRYARAEWAVRSERISERCKWTCMRTSEWLSILRVAFTVIPTHFAASASGRRRVSERIGVDGKWSWRDGLCRRGWVADRRSWFCVVFFFFFPFTVFLNCLKCTRGKNKSEEIRT